MLGATALGALVYVGCTDPGAADYQKCQELEQANEVEAAIGACNAAYEKSPEGDVGMKARTKAVALAARKAKGDTGVPPEMLDDVDARNAAAEKTRQRIVKMVEEGDKARIAKLEKLIEETTNEQLRASYEKELEIERQIAEQTEGEGRKKLEKKRQRIRDRRMVVQEGEDADAEADAGTQD